MTEQDHATTRCMIAYGGSFVRAIGEAALVADPENLARLKAAWPEYWANYTARAASVEKVIAGAFSPQARAKMRYCDTDEGAKQTDIYLHLK